MKKTISYLLVISGILYSGLSAAITVNVHPTRPAVRNPAVIKQNYCEPGAIVVRNGYRYSCTAKGEWIRANTPAVDVKKPYIRKPKVNINY